MNNPGDVIREHGWCQGRWRDGAGRHCAMGAMDVAGAATSRFSELMRLINDCDMSTPDWNDEPDRTEAEVIQALDALYVVYLQEEGIEPADVL